MPGQSGMVAAAGAAHHHATEAAVKLVHKGKRRNKMEGLVDYMYL